MMFGVASITVIYLLVNLAYLKGVGFEAATKSNAIAADVLTIPLGVTGGKVMSILIMISALGAANGMAFAGARVYTALGKDYRLFRALASRDEKSGAPRAALVATIYYAIPALFVGYGYYFLFEI